jgi:hypothetical protein
MNKLDRLIRSAIKESMDEKAEELQSMIQDEDWNPNGPVTLSAQSTDISEDDEFEMDDEESDKMDKSSGDDEETCKYHMDNFGPDDERTQMFCEGIVTESLKGKQKKLDKNKNNKLDAEDFKLLRKSKGKKEVKEIDVSDLKKGGKYKYKSPSFAFNNPRIILSNVDLPEPISPINAIFSPSFISKLNPSIIGLILEGYLYVILRSEIKESVSILGILTFNLSSL